MTHIQQKVELSPKVFNTLQAPQATDNVEHTCGIKTFIELT
jgi:hypothetical protein